MEHMKFFFSSHTEEIDQIRHDLHKFMFPPNWFILATICSLGTNWHKGIQFRYRTLHLTPVHTNVYNIMYIIILP